MFSNLNRTLEYLILPENSTLIPILNMSERVGGTYLAQELPLKLYKKLQKSALKTRCIYNSPTRVFRGGDQGRWTDRYGGIRLRT